MPSATERPSYKNITWAELIELDLSLFGTPRGKEKLAAQLKEAVHTVGYFVVKNFGIDQDVIEDQFNLCTEIFDLPLEEKVPFHNSEAWLKGDIRGYRPIGSKLHVKKNFKGGHKDNAQFYNVPKHDGVHDMKHPAPIEKALPQISDFTQQITENIVHKILILIAIILQLPDENVLARLHDTSPTTPSDDLLRYMRYNAIPISDSDANNGIYVAPHVDFGTLTLSFRQPIAGLQIQDAKDEWLWVKPMNDGVVVNVGDWLASVTGRSCRSGVHRVHCPPMEQIHLDREAVIFFSRCNTDAVVECVKDSPLGVKWEEDGIEEGLDTKEFLAAWLARRAKRDAAAAAAK